jgi:hypothetical protein
MRRTYHPHAYAALVSALLIACTDPVVEPVDDGDELLTSTAEVSVVARGFALALASPQMRAMIRDAMRASDLNEHKLVLQDFADTPEGRQLLAAAASELAMSEERLIRMVKGLPEFDFYAPFAKHRREWRATADVTVAATFDPENRYLDAFSITGEMITLDYEDGVPSLALLILHPGERKVRQVLAHRRVGGETIEDPDERARRVDRAVLQSVGFSPESVYIDFFNYHGDDLFAGDAELYFDASIQTSAGSFTGTYYQGNVENDEGYDVTAPLIHVAPRAVGEVLRLEVTEHDPWGGSDRYGPKEWRHDERLALKTLDQGDYGDAIDVRLDWFAGPNRIPSAITISPSQPAVAVGATLQLSYVAYDQAGNPMAPSHHAAPTWQTTNPAIATVSSTGLVTGNSQGTTTIKITICPTLSPGSPCKQATFPLTVFPGMSVYISGPQYIARFQSAQYTANASYGSPPYTYQWRGRDRMSSGNFGQWAPWYSTGSQNYTFASINSCGITGKELEVMATDAASNTRTNTYLISLTNPC